MFTLAKPTESQLAKLKRQYGSMGVVCSNLTGVCSRCTYFSADIPAAGEQMYRDVYMKSIYDSSAVQNYRRREDGGVGEEVREEAAARPSVQHEDGGGGGGLKDAWLHSPKHGKPRLASTRRSLLVRS